MTTGPGRDRGRRQPGGLGRLAWGLCAAAEAMAVACVALAGRPYAFDVRGCGKPVCQPRAFVQLSTSQAYQGSSIAVSGGKVLLNSTDNTPFPAPSQTNLYVLALT
jgi:hypothetical protein